MTYGDLKPGDMLIQENVNDLLVIDVEQLECNYIDYDDICITWYLNGSIFKETISSKEMLDMQWICLRK